MQQNPMPTNEQEKMLIQKIRSLSPEKVSQVIDLIDFLSYRDNERQLIRAAYRITESAFGKIWDNPEDDIYDSL